MTNVIPLNLPLDRQNLSARLGALITCFASHRRDMTDVFWLKENAEVLNILHSTGAEVSRQAMDVLAGFYETAVERLTFFPQYYRFILSIVLDMEDLGYPGRVGAGLAAQVAARDLPGGELSDLQRAEARRLLRRRGLGGGGGLALRARLAAFANRSDLFAVPNKKAAYELTHIVFYLSDYGHRPPGLDPAALISLEYVGILAYLEQNADLMAEVCVALRYAGQTPPPLWEEWLSRQAAEFALVPGGPVGAGDGYHDFLVCNWALATARRGGFDLPVPSGPLKVLRPSVTEAPLHQMSRCLFALRGARNTDWAAMQPQIAAMLSPEARVILTEAATAPHFVSFFAGFVRAGINDTGQGCAGIAGAGLAGAGCEDTGVQS